MISATEFRGNLYHFLDQVLATGQALEVKRHGHILKIIPEAPKPKKNKLVNLKLRKNVISCTPDELIHQEWLSEWNKEDQ